MEITRRDFIRSSLLMGGSLLFSPLNLHAVPKKAEGWRPAYEKLEKEGKLAERIKEARQLNAGDPQLKKLERTITLARIKRRLLSFFGRFRSEFTFQDSLH